MADKTGHATSFKYDLAISLRDTDRVIAEKIVAKLKDKYNIFFYGESQKDLAFRDGVEKLSGIYRYESRGVLILWRNDWGNTDWTRIEAAVVRERYLKETSRFMLLVPMEVGQVPAWLTPTYFYQEFEKLPFDYLLGAIVGKLGELKADVRTPTPLEVAQRNKAARDWNAKRERQLCGNEADEVRTREFDRLRALLHEQMVALAPTIDGRPMELEAHPRRFSLIHYPCSAVISQEDNPQTAPFIRRLSVEEFDGIVGQYGPRNNSIPPDRHHTAEYAIDVNEDGDWFWRDLKTNDVLTTSTLADRVLTRILERANEFAVGTRTRKNRRVGIR